MQGYADFSPFKIKEMFISIYYSIDSGTSKVMTIKVSSGLSLYHNDDPETLRRTCVDLIYGALSDNGRIKVGKITILNVFIA